ncbi:MAG: cytochrome c oxidase subunit I [Gammaproteobacteria bacterium]|nr:MAG: cytochrome c oxidase subunit I [Gammaproteobacteria bacterium]TND02960.1 MAG: cytochrome c oxidase subunit I [Gammaproteobacteria bacterium]
MNEPWVHAEETAYRQYTLYFVYACIIYSLIGFSWGALMGGIAEFRYFVDHRLHGDLIVRAHTHINLLGWVEMAIFAAVYYIVPRLVHRPIYSLKMVRWHFWIHNFGLIGMVVFFSLAGLLGGMESQHAAPEQVEVIIRPLLASVGIFGSFVLLANGIWAFNLFRTCSGWKRAYEA